MTSHSQAALLVSFEQVDNDVVATWTGSIDLGQWDSDFNFIFPELVDVGATNLISIGFGGYEVFSGGTVDTTSLAGAITSFTGSAGFIGTKFYVVGAVNSAPPASSVYDFDVLNITQTFGSQTLAGIGASSFNNTLAWTSSELGTNTISYTTVPEPSSTALVGLGALALAVRRRR